jgi:hypothetical protein
MATATVPVTFCYSEITRTVHLDSTMSVEMLRKTPEYRLFVEETYLEHDIPEENRWEPSVLVPSPRVGTTATLHQMNLLSGAAGIHVFLTGFEPHICNQAKKLRENNLLCQQQEVLTKGKKNEKKMNKKEINSGRLVSQETEFVTRDFLEGEMEKMRMEIRSEALERAEQMRSDLRNELKEEMKKNSLTFLALLSFFDLIGRTREKIVADIKFRLKKDYRNWTELMADPNAQHQIDRSICELGVSTDLRARLFNEDKRRPLSLEELRQQEEQLRGSEEFSEFCAPFSQLIDLIAEREALTLHSIESMTPSNQSVE